MLKKITFSLLILSLLTVSVSGNVSILEIDNVPLVSWTSDKSYIAKCPAGIPYNPVSFGSCAISSIGLASPSQGDRLVICSDWGWYTLDTLYLLDPATLEILNKRSLGPNDFDIGPYPYIIEELHVPRYQLYSDSLTIFANIGNDLVYTSTRSVSYEVYLASASMDLADSGSMILCDTLTCYLGYGFGPPRFLGPIVLSDLNPLIISYRYYCDPMFFHAWISSFLHQEQTAPADEAGDMAAHCIWGYTGDPYSGTFQVSVSTLGSSSYEAVGIWSDSTDTQYYSVFEDSIAPSSTAEYPFPHPTPSEPAAMSRNPLDSGILLAWYQNGEIRARHWEGEWNNSDYIIASGQPSIDVDEIAVCSVDDGYWVTWLPDGANQPILEYVERGAVTGIETDYHYVPTQFILHASENPFTESVSIFVEGYSIPCKLEVFDLSGRLVRILENNYEGNTFMWDGKSNSGREMPPGAYFIQTSSTDNLASIAVVKL